MPRIRDILPAVLALRSSVIDQALSAALAHADPEEMGDLGKAVLDRGKANGAEALIAQYHRLPRATQHRMVAEAERYATSIRRAASHHGPKAATNALAIIEQAASTRLAYLVTSLCRHADPEVRKQAGRCLLAMAQRAASSHKPGAQPYLDAASTKYLTEAVEQAVVMYSRQDQPELLLAMLCLMPRPLPEAAAALRNPDHAGVGALTDLIVAGSPQTTRALLPCVSIHPLADTCRSALMVACRNKQLGEALVMGHLLALPATRRGLRRKRQIDMLWPDAGQQKAMPAHARRWLPAYLDALTTDAQERAIRLSLLIRKTDLATRLAVLRRLLRLARANRPEDQPAADNANDSIALLTRDPDPAIARTALWHLIHTDYAGLPRILADLINSRHDTIRRVASKQLAPLGFERFWQAWPKLDPKRRVAAGRALIKIDSEFHRHLANRLASRDPDNRLRALVIIATLNQGCFFEDALLELCASNDLRIVASAVKALSGCTSDAAKKTLELAMEHEDPRIRANAVEAIGHAQAAANLDKLVAMSQQAPQRQRANAIKVLFDLRAKDAMPSLTRMLSDERTQHRISALWLIDEIGILQVARMVAEMSLSDEDEQVKQRAGRVIQHLIEDLAQQTDAHQLARDPDQPTEAA